MNNDNSYNNNSSYSNNNRIRIQLTSKFDPEGEFT